MGTMKKGSDSGQRIIWFAGVYWEALMAHSTHQHVSTLEKSLPRSQEMLKGCK